MPELEGRPVHVRFLANLHVYRGRLTSDDIGESVHAGCDVRKRQMVLDAALRSDPREFRRILVHELFHFAWVRLGNRARHSYSALVGAELERRARGELGWSAQLQKNGLSKNGHFNGRQWRDYVCESFCDTGAWLYAGLRHHAEFTLARKHRDRRAHWFSEYYRDRKLSI